MSCIRIKDPECPLRDTYVTTTTPLALPQASKTCSGLTSKRVAMSFTGPSTGPFGWCVRGLKRLFDLVHVEYSG